VTRERPLWSECSLGGWLDTASLVGERITKRYGLRECQVRTLQGGLESVGLILSGAARKAVTSHPPKRHLLQRRLAQSWSVCLCTGGTGGAEEGQAELEPRRQQ
jgi:hypothetical protein